MVSLSGRLTGIADWLTARALSTTRPWLERATRALAHRIGALGVLLRDFAGLPAHRAAGAAWTVVFVGPEGPPPEVARVFFGDEAITWHALGVTPMWRLSRQCRRWLGEGADLVVCETSALQPRVRRIPFSFTVAYAVDLVLWLPREMDSLLASRRMRGTRARIRKAERAGYACRSTQDMADYEHFYHRMYVPHMQARHGALARVAAFDGYLLANFRKGGLLFVTLDGTAVAGQVWYMAGDTFVVVEKGILDSDPELLKQGISQLVDWYCWTWASNAGAAKVEMGRSLACGADGLLASKTAWGGRPTRPKFRYSAWRLCARQLPIALQAHLNRTGLIAEIRGGLYRVLLAGGGQPPAAAELQSALDEATSLNLNGVAVFAPDAGPVVHRDRPSAGPRGRD